MKNKIIADHGEWVEVDVSTPLHGGAAMFIDKDDWLVVDGIADRRISAYRPGNVVYAHFKLDGHLYIVHQLIVPSFSATDHIDYNGLNNRRSNLRECNNSTNQINRPPRKDNKSGVTGVSFRESTGLWRAGIRVNRRQLWLGAYTDFTDAVKARMSAEEEYYPQFSFNSQKQGEINVVV